MFSERFSFRFLSLCSAVLILAVATLPAAYAEEEQQAAASSTMDIEEVVVTGTRIRDRNVYSSSQITRSVLKISLTEVSLGLKTI